MVVHGTRAWNCDSSASSVDLKTQTWVQTERKMDRPKRIWLQPFDFEGDIVIWLVIMEKIAGPNILNHKHRNCIFIRYPTISFEKEILQSDLLFTKRKTNLNSITKTSGGNKGLNREREKWRNMLTDKPKKQCVHYPVATINLCFRQKCDHGLQNSLTT